LEAQKNKLSKTLEIKEYREKLSDSLGRETTDKTKKKRKNL